MSTTRRTTMRWISALTCALLLSTTAALADAQEREPTSVIAEVKLGPYMPQIDSEVGNGGPYQEFFGGDSMLYGEFELDYNLWQGIGTAGIAGHIGYGRISAPVVDQNGEVIDSEERMAFRITPLRASAVYRYDYSLYAHGIPLVPVVKAGLNYYLWRVITPGGDTAEADGRQASGGMLGWHATIGLHFHLNAVDPRRAANLGLTWGVQNSYLFAEFTVSRPGAFRSGGLDLSANHWAAGLAFEF